MDFSPKLSIIIAAKNVCDLLSDTLYNIQKQTYPHIEVIVIDGNSQDRTKTFLSDNPQLVTKWLSEPDQGIADAFNKGILLATGDYINFQGAGDGFVEPGVISELFSEVSSDIDMVCGRVLRVSEDGQTPIWSSHKHPKKFEPRSLLYKMSLPHQALFTHRRFFEKYGLFDLNCKFSMDYEILLRAYHRFPSVKLSNLVVSNWRAGGVGTDKITYVFDEYHRIKTQHKVAPVFILNAIDVFNRFKYHIKTKLLKVAY